MAQNIVAANGLPQTTTHPVDQMLPWSQLIV